ncbi:YeiH family protein [Streptococcus cameli]
MSKCFKGVLLCFCIAIVAKLLGNVFPIVGGAVFALAIGIGGARFFGDKEELIAGITFSSKKLLQYAVVLLGFGLNLIVILETGRQSLPIIISTISIALLVSYFFYRLFGISSHTAILVGVGSSICGGSAIAATAPVIEAEEEEVARAISVIFFYNLVAAVLFPLLGQVLGFSTESGINFGVFAGTAINDTSSVTAAASTWDSLFHLGSETLDTAVTVKLTRTLAIIPITVFLSFWKSRSSLDQAKTFSLKKVFPTFIVYFLLASLLTTFLTYFGIDTRIFQSLKNLSKFFIMMAMAGIGLKTNLLSLLKNGKSALILGGVCWLGITMVSLVFQYVMKLI